MAGCNDINYYPVEVIERRKAISDAYSDTDNLTRGDTNNNDRAAAYKSKRDILDSKEIRELEAATDESEMLHELELLERDYIYER